MKLKYKFVVRNVRGKPVAVAVGKDNELFNGMIKLNSSGEWIFSTLNHGPITQDELLSRFVTQFGTTEDLAKPSVLAFLDNLRQNGLLDE
jgi:hypothetical protein